jgi:hypothetical protein
MQAQLREAVAGEESAQTLDCLSTGLAKTLYMYGVYTVFLAGKSPNIRSYMVFIRSSGQPYVSSTQCSLQGVQAKFSKVTPPFAPCATYLSGAAETSSGKQGHHLMHASTQ